MLYVLNNIRALRQAESILMSAPALGFDVECTSLDFDKLSLVGYGFSTGANGDHFYVPIGHQPQPSRGQARLLFNDDSKPQFKAEDYQNAGFDEAIDLLRRIATRRDLTAIIHNYSFEYGVLREYGIDPAWKPFDTMLANWIFEGRGGNDLASVSNSYLRRGRSDKKFADTTAPYGGRIEWTPIPVAAKYCAREDAGDTYDLWDRVFRAKIEEWGLEKVFNELEMEIPPIIQSMVRRGVRWDTKLLNRYDEQITVEIEEIDAAFKQLTESPGLNIGSPKQLSDLMFDRLGWWDKSLSTQGKKGDWSTKSEIIESLAMNATAENGRIAARMLLRRRKLAKLQSAYTRTLVQECAEHEDGRARHSILQHGTDTGRFSASRIHQIPRPEEDLPNIREAVIAEEGWELVGGDYSQVELRVMAHESRDPRLMQAYMNDEDIHTITSEQCECTRQNAKPINFGLIYLMSPYTLAATLGVPLGEAQRYHKAYFVAYAGVARYHTALCAHAEKQGFVRTLAGRHRVVPDIKLKPSRDDKEKWNRKKAAMRVVINTRIQGSAADIIKIGMRNFVRRMKALGYWEVFVFIIIQVHDELILEVKKEYVKEVSAILQHEMENAVSLRVPLKFEVKSGRTWYEVK